MRKDLAGVIPDWKTTTNRYVGFIDIMGFKDLVAKSNHKSILKMMKKVSSLRKLYASIDWGDQPNLVRATTYSDSIIVYSKNANKDSLHSFVCTVSALTDALITEGIPHKGAVAFGMKTLDIKNSIFFGQPLIDAYLLQEELYYYGIIIHGTAQKGIERYNTIFVSNYFCPLKKGNTNHLTIYPIHGDATEGEKYYENSKSLDKALKKMRYSTSGNIRKYIDNTEVYLKFIRDKG